MSYMLQFIDSARFMTRSLSNLLNILSKETHIIKCKYGYGEKKSEICGIKYKYCNCFVESTNFKDDLIEYKCLCCNKNYKHKFDEKLREQFLIHTNFLTTKITSLFYCCKKVFILKNYG